jgi:hypothetical protein
MAHEEHSEIKVNWWAYHCDNPKVWELFERYTLLAMKSRNHYSHWDIISRIRWHVDIETTDKEFKINNNYAAFYARLFITRHPTAAGFFNLREMKH